MALTITITDAGRAEVINAEHTGTGPVTISEVGFGTGRYMPTKGQTALQAQVKRLTTIAGQSVAPDTIHVTVKDESAAAYNVGEIGLFSDKGTLIAVFSQPAAQGWIIQKAAPSTLLLATDIILESLDAGSFVFGDVLFLNPPATETVPGVVELATDQETQAGTDRRRAVTPAGLKSQVEASAASKEQAEAGTAASVWMSPLRVFQAIAKKLVPASATVQGVVELATDQETQAGTDSARAVTPAGLKSQVEASAASKEQAEAGTAASVWMSPLRVFQAIAKQLVPAAESVAGIAKLASQAEVLVGTDDAKIVTPKKLRWGFSLSIGTNSYIVLPSWLGGIILQFGIGATGAGGIASIPFPLQFPLSCNFAGAILGTAAPAAVIVGSKNAALNRFEAYASSTAGDGLSGVTIIWLAIGR